jgi:hypothetical protein
MRLLSPKPLAKNASSAFGGCEADGGEAIGAGVGLAVEFLTKNIWVDFLVTEVANGPLQNGCKASKRGSAPPMMGVPL